MEIYCFSLFYVIVNVTCLDCGLKTSNLHTSLWRDRNYNCHFSLFSHFIDKTINQENNLQIELMVEIIASCSPTLCQLHEGLFLDWNMTLNIFYWMTD